MNAEPNAFNRACRVCDCRELSACTTDDGPCAWVDADLCSGCEVYAHSKSRGWAFVLEIIHLWREGGRRERATRHLAKALDLWPAAARDDQIVHVRLGAAQTALEGAIRRRLKELCP